MEFGALALPSTKQIVPPAALAQGVSGGCSTQHCLHWAQQVTLALRRPKAFSMPPLGASKRTLSPISWRSPLLKLFTRRLLLRLLWLFCSTVHRVSALHGRVCRPLSVYQPGPHLSPRAQQETCVADTRRARLSVAHT